MTVEDQFRIRNSSSWLSFLCFLLPPTYFAVNTLSSSIICLHFISAPPLPVESNVSCLFTAPDSCPTNSILLPLSSVLGPARPNLVNSRSREKTSPISLSIPCGPIPVDATDTRTFDCINLPIHLRPRGCIYVVSGVGLESRHVTSPNELGQLER